MKKTHIVKYRQPGQWFWRTLKSVKGDVIEGGIRAFHMEDDSMIFISLQAEVYFPPERQAIITHEMSQKAGQQVQRAD